MLERYQDTLMYWASTIMVAKIVCGLVFVPHWGGCLYGLYYGGFVDGDSVMYRYWACVYWAMQTFTGVGYGDMTGDSTTVHAMTTICIGFGAVVNAVLISQVLNALNPESHERKRQEKLQAVMSYIKVNNLPKSTSRRVMGHVRKQDMRQYADRDVIMSLPNGLRVEIFSHLFLESLTKVHLFRGSEGDEFINAIIAYLKPTQFVKGSLVYAEGDLASDGVHIITSGTASNSHN